MTNNTFALQALRDCYEGVGSAEQQKSVAAHVVLLQDLVLRMVRQEQRRSLLAGEWDWSEVAGAEGLMETEQ